MDFRNSETKNNLMRAFAGESQARNRYTIAAGKAREEKPYVIEEVIQFTAETEKKKSALLVERGGTPGRAWRYTW